MTCFHDGSTSIAARGWKRPSRSTRASNAVEAVGRHPVPGGVAGQGRPRHDEDQLIHAAPPRGAPGRLRADRPARPRPGRPDARARRASRRSTARRSRSRAATARPFVARIPAPIAGVPAAPAGSCRASRRRRGRPPAASPARRARGTADGLDQRRGEDQREVADRGDGRVVLGRRPSRTGRAPQARARRGHDVGVAVPGPRARAR